MKVYSGRISTRDAKIPVWPLGDIHYGHQACDLAKLKKYLAWADRANAYVFLMGDLLEMALPIHKPDRGDVYHSDLWPDQQINGIKKILEPLKGRVLAAIDGTHESRFINLTHMSPTSEICVPLGAQYIPTWPAQYELKVGTQTYRFLIGHGSGYSQKSDYQIRKAMTVFPDSEIIVMGHNHRIYSECFTKLTSDGDGNEIERKVYGVRSGAFLGYADYARQKVYEPCRTGSPVIYLYSRQHIISVNTSGFPENE